MKNKGAISIRGVGLIILSLIVVAFLLQNFQTVEIQFLAWEWSMSRAILILLSMVVGLIIGIILGRELFRKKNTKEGAE